MRWGRRKQPTVDQVELEETGTVTIVGPAGSPTTEPQPDDAVLEELSQVFAGDERPTITIGVDDDLPDARYLDEEFDGNTSSGPVFIDDDGSGDAVQPKDATGRGMEPRLRQRRIGVRRAASRRRLWWVGGIALAVVMAVGVLAVLGSSLFDVEKVTVTGNVYADQERLDAIVDDLEGTPVLLVDQEEFEERIEEIPWVEEARVRTDFPNTASIEIRERTAVVAIPGADGLTRVLDAEGRVLSLIDGRPVAPVWISGPGTLELSPGEFAPIGYSAAASLVPKFPPAVRGRLDSMTVTADGADLVVLLTSPSGLVEVRFGAAVGEGAQIEKLVRLERVLEDVGDTSVSVIDVSTPEVTVR